MQRYFQFAFTMLLIAGVVACSPGMATTATLQPATNETSHALTTRTGIEEIDRILDASGDVQKLRSLMQFTSAVCTKRDGLGGPPKCLPDEGEGTPVDVFPFLGPEGSFLRKDEIQDWQGFEASGLYAIYEVSSSAFSDVNYPAGHYAILFAGKDNQPATSLRIGNGRIVRVDFIFEDSIESLDAILQRESARLILAPRSH
jgi:hypothetical protein